MAGIDEDPTRPGFQHSLLHPQFDVALGHAGATYQSPYGSITSAWSYTGDTIAWNVVIPPNTTAKLQFPAGRSETIIENGKLHPISTTPDSSFTIGSGTYHFTIRPK